MLFTAGDRPMTIEGAAAVLLGSCSAVAVPLGDRHGGTEAAAMKHRKHRLAFWRTRDRWRREVLAEARRRDAAEARAARERILRQPTAALPIVGGVRAPLMMRGQAARSSRPSRTGVVVADPRQDRR
jgi:hypothetical protein